MKKILTMLLCIAILTGTFTLPGVFAGDKSAALLTLESSSVFVDGEKKIVKRVCGIPTADELIAQFANDGADLTLSFDGEALSGDERVPNGALLTVRGAETPYTVVITGDADSSATISVKDVICILRSMAGVAPEDTTGVQDANCDGVSNIKDAMLILRYIAGWDVTVGVERIEYIEDAVVVPDELEDLLLCFGNDTDKHDMSSLVETGKATDTIRIAKNEIGFTQLFLSSLSGIEGLTVEITPFTHQNGAILRTELLSEYSFKLQDAETGESVVYPDALPPVQGEIKIDMMTTAGFVVKAFAEKDSATGLYRATVTVKLGSDVVKKAYVYADVWDFVLSDETACATAFGLSRYDIYVYHKQYDPDDEVLYKTYYDYMIENRISPYYIPYPVLDERADEYMSDPRVSSFMIDGRNSQHVAMTDDELAKAYEKLSANEEWMKKGYFYYEDEPDIPEELATFKASGERLKRLFPDYRLVVPTYTNMLFDGRDLTSHLSEYVTLWCPLTDFWTDLDCTAEGASVKFDAAAVEQYGDAATRFGKEVAEGDELWWYVCYWPKHPYPNFLSTQQGHMARLVLWQTYMFDVDGLLYWTVNQWYNGKEWRTMDVPQPFGDGRLIYCGTKFDVRGPIGTIRLEQVRDGIEDYQYMSMIEEAFGRERALELVNKVTTDLLEYSNDSDLLRAVREEMGDLLESYYKGQ